MTVIYIAGPFRAANAWLVEQNIRRAEELALAVWRMGAAVICPHTNTRFFNGAAEDRIWLEGDLELLRRSDAVLVTPQWTGSSGTKAEIEYAMTHGIPVFYYGEGEGMDTLQRWLGVVRRNEVPNGQPG
jgi:nucleoside 2-deoxyribosyltransferase